MRLVAQILSIFGGLVGLFSALGVLVLGEPALAGDAGSRGDARLLGLIALIIAGAGIIGGIAISQREELALPLQLLAAGAGFVPLGWGWTFTGVALATGALLTILSNPDRRPRRAVATATHHGTSSSARRWASDTLLRPQQRLGFGGGIIYVLVMMCLVFGAVQLLSVMARMMS
jgi:hypothetical protein